MEDYTRSIVYGGVDGIITMFNIISGVSGSKLDYKVILILGFSTLLADAISMGFSDFLSTKANNKVDNEKDNPYKHGLVTFMAFIIFGCIPLVTFYVLFNSSAKNIFAKSSIATLISLFLLGSQQSQFTGEKWYKSGISVAMYGGIASIVSYMIGRSISKVIK